MIFKEEEVNLQVSDDDVGNFATNIYKLYKRQIFQAFSKFETTGKFPEKFHKQVDSYALQNKFRMVNMVK